MPSNFKPAKRVNVPLLIGIAGGTGSGKTYSALRLATGLAGKGKIAVIDTEAGRALHYADQFKFDHDDLRPPFAPAAYAEAIAEADAANYSVIVVDSVSHVWAGDGGVLEMQEDELERMAKGDWKKREACKMASWIKPKMAHKKMVSRLLQIRAHVILCLRAEERVEMVKNDKGKYEIVPKRTPIGLDGWVPICESKLPYELTLSTLLLHTTPGVPQWIKLQEQHKPFFQAGKPIDEHSGEHLAAWAKGTAGESARNPSGVPQNAAEIPADTLTQEQVKTLMDKVREGGGDVGRFMEWACREYGIETLLEIQQQRMGELEAKIEAANARRKDD